MSVEDEKAKIQNAEKSPEQKWMKEQIEALKRENDAVRGEIEALKTELKLHIQESVKTRASTEMPAAPSVAEKPSLAVPSLAEVPREEQRLVNTNEPVLVGSKRTSPSPEPEVPTKAAAIKRLCEQLSKEFEGLSSKAKAADSPYVSLIEEFVATVHKTREQEEAIMAAEDDAELQRRHQSLTIQAETIREDFEAWLKTSEEESKKGKGSTAVA